MQANAPHDTGGPSQDIIVIDLTGDDDDYDEDDDDEESAREEGPIIIDLTGDDSDDSDNERHHSNDLDVSGHATYIASADGDGKYVTPESSRGDSSTSGNNFLHEKENELRLFQGLVCIICIFTIRSHI